MKMTIDQIRKYLRDKIDNSWYYNARIDYGVSGRFLDAQAYGDKGQHLYIIWEEDGKRYKMPVGWWTEYSAEQVYNIWMEFGGDEDTEELPPEPAPEPTGTQEAGKVTLYQGEHHKWEIVKVGNDTYEVTFFEYEQGRDWFRLGHPDIYNREALEFEFAEFDLSALFGPPVTSDTEASEEPQATQSIKFFWNGIKVNGEKKLIRCRYSLDNSTAVSVPCVTIYARDYSGELPGDLFAVRNDTDSYQDYFCTDEAVLDPAHPLYHYARAAAIKAELRNEKHYRAEKCDLIRQERLKRLWKYKQELETLPTGQPTAADVEAVHALNIAAETARIAAEKEREQREREAVLCAKINGRHYIEEVSAAHPIQEGAPVVTIEWSEHPAFYSWEDGELKLSVAAAEIVLRHFDEERAERNAAEGRGGYDKTSFVIEYTAQNGELSTYEGRYDLGDNDGGLIAHIRAFAESYRDKRLPYHSEEDAVKIFALADLLETHTAAGRVVSVSVAPWLEKAVKARQEAAKREKREAVEDLYAAVEMLTDQQLAAAVLQIPINDPAKLDVARFFLQAISRRDEKKALAVFKAWRSGAGLEFLGEI